MANKQEKNGIKKLVAGVAIGLAVVMSLGALVIAGKAMGWFEKASEEPQETLEALNFEETAYGTYAVSLKDYDAEEVVIPEEYEGKKVTEIQGNSYLPLFINIEELGNSEEETKQIIDEASGMIDSSVVNTNALGIERGKIGFAFATNLKKITIPDTVVKIYDGAFIGCYSLTEIIIPDSVREIGTYAFLGATELEKIVFPESRVKLQAVVLPASLKFIGDSTFDLCGALKTVYNLSSLEIEAGSEEYGGVARYAENVYTELPETSAIK